MQSLEAFFAGRFSETPGIEFSGGGALQVAFEAMLGAHAQQMEELRRSNRDSESRVAAAESSSSELRIAASAFTAALSRISYRANEQIPMDFLAAMDDAAVTSAVDEKDDVNLGLIPGGREATETLGAFLCDVEADRQARATLEAQLRAESARSEDFEDAVELLQVR